MIPVHAPYLQTVPFSMQQMSPVAHTIGLLAGLLFPIGIQPHLPQQTWYRPWYFTSPSHDPKNCALDVKHFETTVSKKPTDHNCPIMMSSSPLFIRVCICAGSNNNNSMIIAYAIPVGV